MGTKKLMEKWKKIFHKNDVYVCGNKSKTKTLKNTKTNKYIYLVDTINYPYNIKIY